LSEPVEPFDSLLIEIYLNHTLATRSQLLNNPVSYLKKKDPVTST
jgi:hypothetical protein